MPAMTPSAAPRASASPLMTSMSRPQVSRTASMKRAALLASRTAAVATTRRSAIPMSRASIANRASAATATLIDPPLNRPSLAMPRPSPAITFSLKMTAGVRVCPA